jgi:hypothetical protein
MSQRCWPFEALLPKNSLTLTLYWNNLIFKPPNSNLCWIRIKHNSKKEREILFENKRTPKNSRKEGVRPLARQHANWVSLAENARQERLLSFCSRDLWLFCDINRIDFVLWRWIDLSSFLHFKNWTYFRHDLPPHRLCPIERMSITGVLHKPHEYNLQFVCLYSIS